jgi:tRNA G18 (ribose-2'-O)-methylase SpoU
MEAINYDNLKWQISGDLKVIALLLGQEKDLQNITASFINETPELGLVITQERTGLPENLWKQVS